MRQAHSFIDLEAIKKSINKKISQGNTSNGNNQEDLKIMAAFSAQNLNKPITQKNTLASKQTYGGSAIESRNKNLRSSGMIKSTS